MIQRMLIVLLSSTFALHGQADLTARIAEADRVLERFYRGESIDAARDRSNKEIEAYNAQAKAVNAELEKARARMEQAQGPGREAYAQLQEMDKTLKDIPDGNDQAGNKRYRERVDARNALAHRVNDLNDKSKAAIDEYNALAKGRQDELSKERQRVTAAQQALDARVVAYNTFLKGGQDITFFTGINRLLADVRQRLRVTPTDRGLQESLAKLRGFRRELGTWAVTAQARQSNGLVVLEVLVEDEPCWLVVDTGAMDTILSAELAEAAGLGRSLVEEVSLVVVGGQRIRGRSFEIPRLTVGDQTLTKVHASAVQCSDVGIDGLLGQSFLKSFVYTIDERTPGKLLLKRR